ncbi:hypothetical protein [Streptomyces sp. NPDC020141]|uniref:hypothetical protein n=1 Tax=Streptomyces sp. NPDC020141 TaxID=3365065 RepID=UPI00378AB70E
MSLPAELLALPPQDAVSDMDALAVRIRLFQERHVQERDAWTVGVSFDIVFTTSGMDGRALLRWMDRHQRYGCGPVHTDARWPYLLWHVPPGTAREWRHPLAICRGRGKIMLPGRGGSSGQGPYWVRPYKDGPLVDPALLYQALDWRWPLPPLIHPLLLQQ